ncbi:MAG: amidophosphoribosyltransferase, partial [Oscillospiraceae bacterium]|nr:amidophosphoribosyltransferase [Oscillospiraceae bacterium]
GSGIPYGIGLIKNKYIGRTFIAPDGRTDRVRLKLSAVGEAVRGKRIVLIDDSIVRGTTCARIVSLLRDAGATEIHMRVTAPPFLFPCFYGTDVDSRENLIACRLSVGEIAKTVGADSLGYFPVEMLGEIAGNGDYCSSCFDGRYPTPVPADTRKNRFEQRLSERSK